MKTPTEGSPPPRRRVRLWAVLLPAAALSLAGLFALVFSQRGLLTAYVENRLRDLLGRELAMEYSLGAVEFRAFPLAASLRSLVLTRRGEPWVLTADEAKIGVSAYHLLFRHGGFATLTLIGPSFRYRQPGDGEGERSGESTPGDGSERRPAFDPEVLLATPVPVRSVTVVQGSVDLDDGAGRRLALSGIDFSADLSRGRLLAEARVGGGMVRDGGRRFDAGRTELKAVVDKTGVTLQHLETTSSILAGKIGGRVDLTGRADLEGTVSLRVGRVAAALEMPGSLNGLLSLTGRFTGTPSRPAASAVFSLSGPVIGGDPWPDIGGSLAVEGRRVTWTGVRMPLGDGRVESSGWLDAGGPVPRYAVDLTAAGADPGAVPFLSRSGAGRLTALEGRAHWEGSGRAPAGGAGSGSFSLRTEAAGWPHGAIEANGRLSLAEGRFLFEEIDVAGGGVELHGSGSLPYGGAPEGVVAGSVEDVAAVLVPLGVDRVSGRLTLNGEITERAGGVGFTGPVALDGARLYGVDGISATGIVEAGAAGISTPGLLLRWREARGTISGAVDPRTKTMALVAALEKVPIEEAARLAGLDRPPGGLLTGTISCEGPWNDPSIHARARIEGVTSGGLGFDRVEGNLLWEGGRVDVPDLVLAAGETRIAVSGKLDGAGHLSGRLRGEGVSLDDFGAGGDMDIAGSVDAVLEGTLDAPRVRGSFKADRLRYGAWDFKGGEGTLVYDREGISLEGHLVDTENRFRVRLDPRTAWQFSAAVTLGHFSPEIIPAGELEALPAPAGVFLRDLSFLAAGELSASGRLLDLDTIRGSLDLDTVWLQAGEESLRNVEPVSVRWSRRGFTVKSFRFTGEKYSFSVEGRGSMDDGWDLGLAGDMDLALLRDYVEQLEEIRLPGEVRLRLTGGWESPAVTGFVVFRDGKVKVRPLPVAFERLYGRADLQEGVLTLTELSGSMGEGSFTASGTYDIGTRLIDARVEGHLDLSLFKSASRAVREMKGPVRASVVVAGPIARPRFLGEAELQGAEIFIPPLPDPLTGITGKLFLDEKEVRITGLAGSFGGGTLQLSGDAAWSEPPGRIDLTLRADEVLLSMDRTAKALIDGTLRLEGAFDAMRLSGDVDLIKARYLRNFGEKSPKFSSSKPSAAVVREEAAAGERILQPDVEGMALDVHFHADDSVWITNNMARIENSLAVDVSGTVAGPEVSGEIRVLHGTVTYLSKRFDLTSGTIYLAAGGAEPMVEAQAETSVGDTQIFFLLEGSLRKPTFHLTSNPPYSQEDLISLLTLGQTRASLEERGGEASAIGAAIAVTGPVINMVGEGAREAVGLDVFQVVPTLDEGGQTARVTLGTHLSDRLFVSYSRSIGATEDQQLRLEYQMLDYLSVLGQELREGIYSLDLVLQFAFE